MLRSLFIRFKWWILFAALLGGVGAFSGIFVIRIFTEELNSMSDNNGYLQYSFFAFFLLMMVSVIFNTSSQYIFAKLSSLLVFDIQKRLVRRILGTPYEKIEKSGGHRITAVMSNDVRALSDGIMLLPECAYSVIVLTLCISFMWYMSWKLCLFVLLMIAIIMVVSNLFMRYGMVYQEQLRECTDTLHSGLKGMVDGGKELGVSYRKKSFFFSKRMLPTFDEIREKSLITSVIFVSLNAFASGLSYFLIAGIIYGSQYLFGGVSIDIIVGFVMVTLYMNGPISFVVESLPRINDMRVSYSRIQKLDLADEDAFVADNAKVEKITKENKYKNWKSLNINNVVYTYDNNMEDYYFSVGPITTTFQRGDVIFLTGGNGSGKSTFAKLLVGLYQPQSGGIYFDDKQVHDITNNEHYKAMYSTIFSDFHLFDYVLNAQGELASDELINTYLRKLKLEGKVSADNGILSSTSLSHGQKKRLALLLSYIEDAPICLYDEWAADQDPYFREYFYTVLLPEMKKKGKLVIVISHDDRYFQFSDRVLKFEEGRLVEDIANSYPKKHIVEAHADNSLEVV